MATRLALSQHGVLSRAQAIACGMSAGALKRALATGKLEPLLPRVYRIPGAPCTWHQKLMATCLWAGEGAVASHRAAAALWGFDDCPPGPVEISMPTAKRPPRSDMMIHRAAASLPTDRAEVQGIPVTAPARTLHDLAGAVDRDRLELALEDALRRRLTSIPRIKWQLKNEGRKGRGGTRALRELLGIRGEGVTPTASALETKVVQVLRSGRIPAPVRQYLVEGTTRKRYIDLAYPSSNFFIECQSYKWHSGRASWHADQIRLNELMALGWRGVMVTDFDLRYRREEFLQEVARGLGIELS